MIFYGVRDPRLAGAKLGDVVGLYVDPAEALRVIVDWNRDEPEHAGVLEIVEIALGSAGTN